MSTGPRRPHADALADAQAFRCLFSDEFEQWEIAGSIRRHRPDVGDIEHVVWPKVGEVATGAGLFGAETAPENLLLRRLDQLLADGTITKHVYSDGKHKWGDNWRGCDFRGYRHELFISAHTGANYGNLLAIRTGPQEFSQMLVDRLLRTGTMRQQDGFLKYVSGKLAGVVLPCPSERQYFDLCGVPWCPPEKRDEIASHHRNASRLQSTG